MTDHLDRRTKLITEGSLVRSLVTISGPIVLTNLLHSAYQLTDTFWVGRLGAGAVASVSVCYPLLFFLMSAGFGLSIAGSVFVAQFAGARQPDKVNSSAAQVLLMVLVVSLLLSVIGYFLAGPALRLIGVGEDIYRDAKIYLAISCIGLVFSFGFFVFQSILRGIGEVRFPLQLIAATVILNGILDPLFIFGIGSSPGYGVAGAAYATIGTQAVAAVIGIYILFRGRHGVHVRWRDFLPDWHFMLRAIYVGLPAAIEQSARTLGSLMLVFLATGFGTLAIATLGIGMRILSFIMIPAFGLAMATTTLVGQNIGAGNRDRADQAARLSAWVAFGAFSLIGVVFYLLDGPLIRLFVPNDPALIGAGAEFVRITSFAFGVMAAQQVLLGAFRGAGGTMAAMLIALVTQWVLQFPVSYVLSRHTSLGAVGIWWGFPVTGFLAMIITLVWFLRGTWHQPAMSETEQLVEELKDEIHLDN
ncbi:MAG: MATE family efflux transporter [Gammaproteobacteria bacterium]|nr:MATE family efflux transporter [Gammaproteobacteria bacterium]